jgi:hypothetical protein
MLRVLVPAKPADGFFQMISLPERQAIVRLTLWEGLAERE